MQTNSAARAQVDAEHFESVYGQYFDLLAGIAEYKFGVPQSEAGTLVHDVLMSYLYKAADVNELRPWLIGAICHASRHYWRLNGKTDGDLDAELDRVDPSTLHILDSLPDQLAAREALECLAPRCRDILQLRYFEGCTIIEVAERMGVTPKYAQKMIAKCLRRAERLYVEKGRAQ